MLRELKLVGVLEAVHLHDGILEVTFQGGATSEYPLSEVPTVPQAPRRPREPKPPKETNGHAAGPALEAE